MTPPEHGLTLALIARIPPEGIASFAAYEARVLPLIATHGGALERRLRSADGGVELHIVSFPSDAAFAAFRADPVRAAAAHLLDASGATTELLTLQDVA